MPTIPTDPAVRRGKATLGIAGLWTADHLEVEAGLCRGFLSWPWRMRIERVNGPMTVRAGALTAELDRGSVPLYIGPILDFSISTDIGAVFYYSLCGAAGVEGFP